MRGIDPKYVLAGRSLTQLGGLIVPDYNVRRCWYHDVIADALEGMLRYYRYRGKRGGYARVSISLPPRHSKSLHGRELFPALALGVDPDIKIMVVSNGGELAKEGVINTHGWMETEEYKATFSTRIGKVEVQDFDGVTKVLSTVDKAHLYRTLKYKDPDNPRAGYIQGKGYYFAQGVGGSITGKGFGIGILDDLIKNAEQAESERYLAKLWAFYTSTFDTRADFPWSPQLYIGTRWTEPDFVDELAEYWEAEVKDPSMIKVIRFPAIAEEPLEDGDPREVGEGLDTVHRSTEWYEAKRRALKSVTPWVWDGLWQQRPKTGGARLFQEKYWVPYNSNFDLRRLRVIDISVDANLSETGASFAVIEVTGVLFVDGTLAPEDGGEHYFLLDEARGHWDCDTLESEFKRVCAKWKAAFPNAMMSGTIWVENKVLGMNLINKFSASYPIVAVPKARSKISCHRLASNVTSMMRWRIPAETWGHALHCKKCKDYTRTGTQESHALTCPRCGSRGELEPLVSHEWIGDSKTKGSWVHEMGSHPSKPDDRRDAVAQQIICRDRTLGIALLRVPG